MIVYWEIRIADDLKLNSTMSLNMPTSREYGRFTLTTSKYLSSTISSSRETNLDSGRYTTNGNHQTKSSIIQEFFIS